MAAVKATAVSATNTVCQTTAPVQHVCSRSLKTIISVLKYIAVIIWRTLCFLRRHPLVARALISVALLVFGDEVLPPMLGVVDHLLAFPAIYEDYRSQTSGSGRV